MCKLLEAEDIECRVQSSNDKGCSLLLYKDARVDMRMLDEMYGPLGWQRTHDLINGNLFCTIEIWDKEKAQWVKKQDVGTESMAEKEKGQASDAFKRAGFNVGIGRELYTAPFIWVTLTEKDFNEQKKIKTKFSVKEIGYNDRREINRLVITDNNGAFRYTLGAKAQAPKPAQATDKREIFMEEIMERPEFFSRVYHKEAETKKQGKAFSLKGFMDQYYVIDDTLFSVLSSNYMNYKINNNLT